MTNTSTRSAGRRSTFKWVAVAVVLAAAASACSARQEIVTVTVTAQQTAASPAAPPGPDPRSPIASSTAPATTKATAAATTTVENGVRVTAEPASGARNVPPNNPVSITVFAATLSEVALTADDGGTVTGALSPDRTSWRSSERLNYATTYTVTGTAVTASGAKTQLRRLFSTVKPTATQRASIQIPDGATVGVGAPIILTFSGAVQNRAAAEKALKVTTSAGAALQGNWGWLQDEQIEKGGPLQSRAHWRPTVSPVGGATPYWPANTKVHVQANLKGVDYGGGSWGRSDITADFTVGRSQIVIADASTFHLVVTVDDKITKNYAVSYGKDSVPGRATVTGIHIVTEKFTTYSMCNPRFDYCNVLENWAVRINNNGEFIHENLKAAAAFGKANVSHGCVNMGRPDAKNYYDSAIYGDPVIVTNTGGPAMTEQDSLYDWIYSPQQWRALSAL